ncbi:MAG: hypothetical protein QG657_998 [Acidobacteriota bacterium]|nr:hypothetical protein [Acidobacteriota bacterium]
MIKNYLLEAFRNIKKNKAFSFITISALTIGITCCILILIWVQDEISFDSFHKNSDEIFRVIIKNKIAEKEVHSARSPNALGPTLKNEYSSDIINFTRTQVFDGWVIQYGDKKFLNDAIAVADPSFFKMFTFSFIKGTPETVFNDDSSLVITENFAKKYFGDEDPMNKIINIGKEFRVTGVIKNIPLNSHIQFDCIFPINNMRVFWHSNLESWQGGSRFYLYIQLQKNSSWKDANKKISGIIKKYIPESKMEVYLQPLKNIHLKSKFEGDLDNYKQGNINYIYILTTIALCILFIASFNFMNLSIARSADRAKGIAIRKVSGANRMDIIKQFLGEAIISSFIALIFAVILVYFLLPVFNDLSDKQLTFTSLGRLSFIFEVIALVLIIGIISGSYPAIFLSSFEPVNILKGSKSTPKKRGVYLRKILVIFQFAITVIFILATIVVYIQLGFIKSKDLGFNPHNVIVFPSAHQLEGNNEAKKALFMSNPNVYLALGGSPARDIRGESSENVNWEGKNPDEKIAFNSVSVDYGYLELYQMNLVEGRTFSKEFSTDISNYILNETAVKAMGIKSPVGKRFWLDGQEGTIIGVVEDFHYSSLHGQIMPLAIRLLYQVAPYVSVRINNPDSTSETLRFLENTWNKINRSSYPFTWTFVDDTIADLYKTDRKIGMITQLFTLITLLVSCLGLFGLAFYTSRRKTKEIGIRKVSGASISDIVWLISKEFLKWVMISLIIAFPIGWYAMNRWLQDFAYRIGIEWWMFVCTTFAALAIAFFTVSYQVIKAARANPVDSLRYE